MAYHSRMEFDVANHGSQTIRHTFSDIYSLCDDEEIYSPYFEFCNTRWHLSIEKIRSDNNAPYLSLYLCKADYEYEYLYSYEVKMAITLLSTDSRRNIYWELEGNSPRSRFLFGTRPGESLQWGCKTLIPWSKLLNPQLGFIGEDGDIEVELDMTLVKILPHHDYCYCSACSS